MKDTVLDTFGYGSGSFDFLHILDSDHGYLHHPFALTDHRSGGRAGSGPVMMVAAVAVVPGGAGKASAAREATSAFVTLR